MKKLLFLLVIGLAAPIQAKIYITVTDANVTKAKLALGKLHKLKDSKTLDEKRVNEIHRSIIADLQLTGLFEQIKYNTYAHLDTQEHLYRIRYKEWGLTGASFALKIGYRWVRNRLSLEAFLYDIPGKKKIFSTRYEYALNQYYRLIHAVAEDVLKAISGEQGLFKSRILMVCRDVNRKKGRVPKDIYIVDPDGRNLQKVTADRTLTLTPAWSRNGEFISYTQYQRRSRINKRGRRERVTLPVLVTHYLRSGKRRVISERKGMNSGAAWAPGGEQLAVTLSYSGRPEIYLLNSTGKGKPVPLSRNIKLRRLSGVGFQPTYKSTLFDVEPSWSPDGSHIVFSSARTGHPMIYVMNVASRLARQLTFAGRYNSSPVWSPKGDKILFAAQHHGNGNFDLYVIDPDGNNLARLTAGGKVGRKKINYENASWAPTGRHFAYTSNESGNYRIYVRTLGGDIIRQVSPDRKECTSPAWGPYEG